MPTNLTRTRERIPITERKCIKVSDKARELYEQRNRGLDNAPNAAPLSPYKWANAMRREEYFRPIKQTTARIDADVLDWLKSKGESHLSRVDIVV